MIDRTPDPVANLGLLPVEDAKDYLDGWLGKNDLRVGPNMLAWALDSMIQHHASLSTPNERKREEEG